MKQLIMIVFLLIVGGICSLGSTFFVNEGFPFAFKTYYPPNPCLALIPECTATGYAHINPYDLIINSLTWSYFIFIAALIINSRRKKKKK